LTYKPIYIILLFLPGLIGSPTAVPPEPTTATNRSTTAAVPIWHQTCADCPKYLLALGDQSAAVDAHGRLHLTAVGDYVYYARYDATTGWLVEQVAPGSGVPTPTSR